MDTRTSRLLMLGLLALLLCSPSLANAFSLGAGTEPSMKLAYPGLPFQLKTWSANVQSETKKTFTVSGKKPKAASVPELDGPSVGSALVLLLGGTLVVLGRRRYEGARVRRESAEGRPS
jgi:hypothetical protein